MSRDNDRHEELLEAAKALALHLGFVKEDHRELLVDQQEYDEETAREDIEQLIEEEHELVAEFENLDEAIKYIELVIDDAS
jgi:hypothetical protein